MKRFLKRLLIKLIAVAVIVGGILLFGWITEDKNDYPGRTEFEAANAKITTNGQGFAYGNNSQAILIAGNFATGMKTMQALMFSGGSGKSYASGGDFVTYCELGSDKIALITHVPELRNYKDGEALDALVSLAWTCAQEVIKGAKIEDPKTQIIIGLRGFGSYGPVLEGKLGGHVSLRTDGSDEKQRLYAYFPETDGSYQAE